jgi:NADH-quinone oxidoreductase subunit I
MALKKWLDKLSLLDLFDGLSVTGRHLFKKKVTIQYPEQKKLPSDRFRGMFRLDEERCIKCTLCAIECPINIIYIDWHNEKNANLTPEYSVLNPETSSDSASGRSNGLRFVSATPETK